LARGRSGSPVQVDRCVPGMECQQGTAGRAVGGRLGRCRIFRSPRRCAPAPIRCARKYLRIWIPNAFARLRLAVRGVAGGIAQTVARVLATKTCYAIDIWPKKRA